MSSLLLRARGWCCEVRVAGVQEPLLLHGGDDEAGSQVPEGGGDGLLRQLGDLGVNNQVR